MNITKNFTLAELTHTTTGLLNIPNNVQIENLKELAINILQPLRDLYGSSIKINSAFRSKAVNTLIKGATTSQHLNGEAADLDSSDNAKLFRTIKDNLPFDQLI